MEEKKKKSLADLKTITLEEGQDLFKEGQEAKGIYYVKEGALAASVLDMKTNIRVKIGNIGPGEVVGEMSYIDQNPRSATVTAMVKSILVEIPEEKFHETVNNQPPWFRTLIKTLVVRLRSSNNKHLKI
jgi:CRP-like cAMP-binding protein